MTTGADYLSADFSKKKKDRGGLGIKIVMKKEAWPWQQIWILEKEESLQNEPVSLYLTKCKLRRKIKIFCHQGYITGKGLVSVSPLKPEY